jgi:hypothetical protein
MERLTVRMASDVCVRGSRLDEVFPNGGRDGRKRSFFGKKRRKKSFLSLLAGPVEKRKSEDKSLLFVNKKKQKNFFLRFFDAGARPSVSDGTK